LYSHELHLQFNIDQGKVRSDAAKFKKESEKARKALCKENEKKRKAEAVCDHSEITTSLAHEDEFSAVHEPQGPSKFNIKILSFDLVFVAMVLLLLSSWL
jgi:hypothetical protein